MPTDPDREDAGLAPLAGAVFANSYRALHPAVASTGFRTHALRLRSLGQASFSRPAEDFLINTRYRREDRESEASIQSYFFDSGVALLSLVGLEGDAGLEQIELPEGVKLRRELGEVLSRRRSRRSFTGDSLPLAFLASIIRAGGAITASATADMTDGGEADLHFRTAPSGGGLYPIDLYLAALRIDQLESALYRYAPRFDRLVRTGDGDDVDAVVRAFAVPEEIIALSQAAAIVLLVARPWRSMRKYGDRGLRFVFIEAGAIAENIHLATVALGYGSVDCASVHEDEIHDALGIDGGDEALIHAIVLGYAD
jgi:SagB-type dehydrogenase family enzyme